jgi:predicted DNA-binding transcriptional regulator YafY
VREHVLVAETPTAGRLLALLSLLQGRREWPGTLLAQRLEVSPRTVRRDVERLRALGYPIDSTSGPAGGYSLTAGAAMPPLLLDDEEALAVAIALRTAARSAVAGIEETALRALVKLEQVLPSHLRRRVQAFGAAEVVGGAGAPTVDAAVLTVLGTACRDGELLRFGYRGRDGERSRRMVEPHALLAHGRRWYLLAFDPSRTGWRTFRVDRVSGPAGAGTRFERRAIPGGDAATYLTRALAGVVYRHEARVRYLVGAGEVRRRVPFGRGELREEPGGGACVYETSDDELDWLAFRIVAPNVDFELLEGSPELRARLRAMARRLSQAAAGGPRPERAQAGAGSSRSTTAKAGRARS